MLRDSSMDSFFLGLNKTSHSSAHKDIFAILWLGKFDALSRETTVISRLVSSAKMYIISVTLFKMSFI